MSYLAKVQQRVRQMRSNIHVQGLGSQAYDPELLAIDSNANVITRRRLGAGFGAPGVSPYGSIYNRGQSTPAIPAPGTYIPTLPPGLGFRQKILTTFPVLSSFPRLAKLLA